MTPAQRHRNAAIALAATIDIQDRMKDPNYDADRSPAAERARETDFRRLLTEYREAAAELDAHIAAT